jgi:hypothetical protein
LTGPLIGGRNSSFFGSDVGCCFGGTGPGSAGGTCGAVFVSDGTTAGTAAGLVVIVVPFGSQATSHRTPAWWHPGKMAAAMSRKAERWNCLTMSFISIVCAGGIVDDDCHDRTGSYDGMSCLGFVHTRILRSLRTECEVFLF